MLLEAVVAVVFSISVVYAEDDDHKHSNGSGHSGAIHKAGKKKKASEAVHTHSLAELCSKECPGAETDSAVGSCLTEKKADPKFAPTQCSIAFDSKGIKK